MAVLRPQTLDHCAGLQGCREHFKLVCFWWKYGAGRSNFIARECLSVWIFQVDMLGEPHAEAMFLQLRNLPGEAMLWCCFAVTWVLTLVPCFLRKTLGCQCKSQYLPTVGGVCVKTRLFITTVYRAVVLLFAKDVYQELTVNTAEA